MNKKHPAEYQRPLFYICIYKIVFSHRKSPFNNFNPFFRDTIGKMARFPADITGNDLGGKANFEPTDLETSSLLLFF